MLHDSYGMFIRFGTQVDEAETDQEYKRKKWREFFALENVQCTKNVLARQIKVQICKQASKQKT